MSEQPARVEFGGMMGDLPSVFSGNVKLECFECHDESLYHDAIAFWNEDTDDLLCPPCYNRMKYEGYIKVLTQH